MGQLPESVDGGEIIRDGSGNPTGTLHPYRLTASSSSLLGILVDNAMSLVPLPSLSTEEMSQYFDRTMRDALSVGLTSIHDAQTEPDTIEFYKE